MMNFYNLLIKEEFRISFKDFEKMVRYIYDILVEIDKFRKDSYHKIFYYTYMVKQKKNQEYIAILLGMDQSTVSRKAKEIQEYIILKIKELKNK